MPGSARCSVLIRHALLLAVPIVLGAVPARAQSMAGMSMGGSPMVSGRVFDDTTGCPLRAATVALGTGGATVTTDVNGRYRMKSIPPAPFSLRVTLNGYRPRQVDSIMVSDSTGRVDFSLHRAPADSVGHVTYPVAACHLEPANGGDSAHVGSLFR